MFWQNLQWNIVRENPTTCKLHSGKEGEEEQVWIYGSTGSIWATREFRLEHFKVDEPPVNNIWLVNSDFLNNSTFSLEVKCFPTIHGAQAGLLYYCDDLNYIKLVVEGDKGGESMIILAIQVVGEADVIYRLGNYPNAPDSFHPLSLQLHFDANGVKIDISGQTFRESIRSTKPLPSNGHYGFMAHSLESAADESLRSAVFRKPRLE